MQAATQGGPYNHVLRCVRRGGPDGPFGSRQKPCHPERSEGSRMVTLGTPIHGILHRSAVQNDRFFSRAATQGSPYNHVLWCVRRGGPAWPPVLGELFHAKFIEYSLKTCISRNKMNTMQRKTKKYEYFFKKVLTRGLRSAIITIVPSNNW